MSVKVFLSYHFDEKHPEYEQFIYRVYYYLTKQPGIEPYCFSGSRGNRQWRTEVGREVRNCNKFVLFVGREFGQVQNYEAKIFLNKSLNNLQNDAICIRMPQYCDITDDDLFQYDGCERYKVNYIYVQEDDGRKIVNDKEAQQCAKRITEKILGRNNWIPDDGLPIGYPFNYEKEIIRKFVSGKGQLMSLEFLRSGCPQRWPKVNTINKKGAQLNKYPNPIEEEVIGGYRPEEAKIIVDTRSDYHSMTNSSHCLANLELFFQEAGPRKQLLYPIRGNSLRTGILVSGGIAPGVNAVIAGIVERHNLYAEKSIQRYALEMRGYLNGFKGLLEGRYNVLTVEDTRKSSDQGGSVLSTSRFDFFLESDNPSGKIKRNEELHRIVNRLNLDNIDILYIIGGDGSMKAGHAIWTIAQQQNTDLSVVCIPKTMDNDILWVWQSFGFLSAVEKAKEFVMQLRTEAQSNSRLCIMQLFGSDSGFVVSHAAVASGVCNLALIPESPFTIEAVVHYIKEKMISRLTPDQLPWGLILLAETAIPLDVEKHIDDADVKLEDEEKEAVRQFIKNKRRVHGKTPDALRRAGLKIVSRILRKAIRNIRSADEFWRSFKVFTNEPKHLIRAISPSVQDVIFGQRLGCLAVDNAMAGYTDFMVSQWLTEYILVPLELVVLGRKRVPPQGIFWKSVLAITGQPADLTKH